VKLYIPSFYILLIITGFINSISAQNRAYLDSLNSILKSTGSDSIRQDIYYKLGYEWAEYNVDSTHYFADLLLESAHNSLIDYELLLAFRLKALAFDYEYKSDSAIVYYEKSKQYAQIVGDKSQLALAYFNIGTVHLLQANYLQVLPYYEEAMAICEANTGLEKELGMIYNNLGIVYRRVRKPEKAAEIYLKAEQLQSTLNNPQGLSDLLLNIANNYISLNDFEKAKIYYSNALDISGADDKSSIFHYSYNGLGVIAFEEGDYELAKDYFLKSLALAEIEDISIQINANGFLGSIHARDGDFQTAKDYFDKAIELNDEEKFPDQAKELFLQLEDYYTLRGEYKLSADYLRKYISLTDRLLNQEIIDRTAEWEERFELQEKEKKIVNLQLLNQQASLLNEKQKNQRNLFGFISVVLVLIIAFVGFQYRNKQKTNKLLSEKNIIISNSLTEKELLMREIHHRVKNNLQVISSLLNMQTFFLEDEKANAAVADSKNRVQAMSLIHQSLYSQENLTEINIQDYLQQLLNNLEAGMNPSGKEITVLSNIEPIPVDVDQAIPIGLIVNELVTNSFKYAFNGKEKGKISISFSKKDLNYHLIIKDDGIGNNGLPLERKSSLGMRLLHDLSKKLKAALDIQTIVGTEISLIFPVKVKFI